MSINEFESSQVRSRLRHTLRRDIGPPPEPSEEGIRRRERARLDLEYFLKNFFPNVFYLPWSKDHLIAIDRIQQCVLHGGLFALAMPRGSGKTAMCVCSSIWAMLYGHSNYTVIVGSTADLATDLLEQVKNHLLNNDLIYESFTEAAYPIRRLEGLASRCRGQTCQGVSTGIEWGSSNLVLPAAPITDWSWKPEGSFCFSNRWYSPLANNRLQSFGITGSIRGLSHARFGQMIRPGLAIVDDPQTDDSAASASQTASRLKVLRGAILGLAGPGKRVAVVVPCTVIHPGDLAMQLLDRNSSPEWQGERFSLVYRWPDRDDLWREYLERYRVDPQQAKEFYIANRDEMDRGAEVAWPERYNPEHGELSAIQHAFHLLERHKEQFWSEFQNDPYMSNLVSPFALRPNDVINKIIAIDHAVAPDDAEMVTVGIDVQANLIYWVCVAFGKTCHILDYGVWPPQPVYHLSRSPTTTLDQIYQGTIDQVLYTALSHVCDELLIRRSGFSTPSGRMVPVVKIAVDAGYHVSTDAVYRLAAEPRYEGKVIPVQGYAGNRSIIDWKRHINERGGFCWRFTNRYTNLWRLVLEVDVVKSDIAFRLRMPVDHQGSITLYHSDFHRCFADHLTAEVPVLVSSTYGSREKWEQIPGRDNHWLDALVYAFGAWYSSTGHEPEHILIPSEMQRQRSAGNIPFKANTTPRGIS